MKYYIFLMDKRIIYCKDYTVLKQESFCYKYDSTLKIKNHSFKEAHITKEVLDEVILNLNKIPNFTKIYKSDSNFDLLSKKKNIKLFSYNGLNLLSDSFYIKIISKPDKFYLKFYNEPGYFIYINDGSNDDIFFLNDFRVFDFEFYLDKNKSKSFISKFFIDKIKFSDDLLEKVSWNAHFPSVRVEKFYNDIFKLVNIEIFLEFDLEDFIDSDNEFIIKYKYNPYTKEEIINKIKNNLKKK